MMIRTATPSLRMSSTLLVMSLTESFWPTCASSTRSVLEEIEGHTKPLGHEHRSSREIVEEANAERRLLETFEMRSAPTASRRGTRARSAGSPRRR